VNLFQLKTPDFEMQPILLKRTFLAT